MSSLPEWIQNQLLGNPTRLSHLPTEERDYILRSCYLRIHDNKFLPVDDICPPKNIYDLASEHISPVLLAKIPKLEFYEGCHSYPDARSVYIDQIGFVAVDNRIMILITNIIIIISKALSNGNVSEAQTKILNQIMHIKKGLIKPISFKEMPNKLETLSTL
jgi:hypothetical protein